MRPRCVPVAQVARRGDRPQRLSGVVRVVDVFAEGPGKGVVILPAACAHDHAGHKGRARRGIEKEGGYYPTKRRKTTHTTAKEKSTAQKKQVDDGSGRGRVALENTIVVGRVYIQRMERKGKNRRDAGRPPGEPG